MTYPPSLAIDLSSTKDYGRSIVFFVCLLFFFCVFFFSTSNCRGLGIYCDDNEDELAKAVLSTDIILHSLLCRSDLKP